MERGAWLLWLLLAGAAVRADLAVELAPGETIVLERLTASDGIRIDDEILYRVGADVFWRPNSIFQLNATVHPDFGNVESDDVVINLTATEVCFPEQRLFFLEDQDIFVATPRADTRGGGVGNSGSPYTMVYTRRIGGPTRPLDFAPGTAVSKREPFRPTDLLGAAKATGQAGGLWYGVLAAFEDDAEFDVVDAGGTPCNLYQDAWDRPLQDVLVFKVRWRLDS